MRSRGPGWVVGFVVLLAVAAVVLPLFSPTATGQGSTPAGDNASAVPEPSQASTPTPVIAHDIPEADAEEGDLEGVETWLEFRLYAQLNESIHHLEAGRPERARSALAGPYDARLERLSEVYLRTDGSGRAASDFERARELQLRLIDWTDAVDVTLDRYQAAKRAGTAREARRLGDSARRDANTTIDTAAELMRTYRRLDNRTSPQYFRSIQSAEEVRLDAVVKRRSVPSSIEGTSINLTRPAGPDANASSGPVGTSYLEPVEIRGVLRNRTGAPVRFQTVDLLVGERVLEARTQWNGSFSAIYRPVGVAPGEQTIRVRYRPAINEPYLPSESSFEADVDAVESRMTMAVGPDPVRAGENVTVEGRVSVRDRGVEGVPVVIRRAGSTVGTVSTDRNGSFRLTAPIGIDAPTGETRFVSSTDTAGWAVEPTSSTATVRVTPVATVLTANGTAVTADRFDVTGRLTTRTGVAVADASVVVTSEGQQVATTRTDRDGEYQVSVARSDPVTPGATLTVAYVPEREGLDRTATTVRGTFREPPEPGALAVFEQSRSAEQGVPVVGPGIGDRSVAALVIAGVLLVGVGAVLARRRGRNIVEEPAGDSDAVVEPSSASTGIAPDRLLGFAEERLAAGDTDLAVIAAYAALRQPVALGDVNDRGLTHWEFLRRWETDGLGPEALQDLRSLTSWSERAAFGPDSVSLSEATEAVSIAKKLVHRR